MYSIIFFLYIKAPITYSYTHLTVNSVLKVHFQNKDLALPVKQIEANAMQALTIITAVWKDIYCCIIISF